MVLFVNYRPRILSRVFFCTIIRAGKYPAKSVTVNRRKNLINVPDNGADRIPSENGKFNGWVWKNGTSNP